MTQTVIETGRHLLALSLSTMIRVTPLNLYNLSQAESAKVDAV